METRRPLIVDIKRGILYDGPGIRTVVFFKGCPLRCVFCHNPEAQNAGPELAWTAERCLECGACEAACARAAIRRGGLDPIDREMCDLCGRCAEICPSRALRMIGVWWPAGELAERLLRDIIFYRRSGGGVTLSGGECMLFPEYLNALLVRLKAAGVHVCLETSGFFEYEAFAHAVLPYLDLVLFDVKLADNRASARFTGRGCGLGMENLRRLLSSRRVEVWPRIPIVPGVTDVRDNLEAIVCALRKMGASDVRLLPYNPLGVGMYARLGRPAPDVATAFMKPEREKEVVRMFREVLAARHVGAD